MMTRELIGRIKALFPKEKIEFNEKYTNSYGSESRELLETISGKSWGNLSHGDLVIISQLLAFLSEEGMMVLFPSISIAALGGYYDLKIALLDFFDTRDRWTIQKMFKNVGSDKAGLICDIIRHLVADDASYTDLIKKIK